MLIRETFSNEMIIKSYKILISWRFYLVLLLSSRLELWNTPTAPLQWGITPHQRVSCK